MKSLAAISTKGGSGKTGLSVSLATQWAVNDQQALLLDLDPQDTGSAAWWLNRTDDTLAQLVWSKAPAAEVASKIAQIKADRVIIDTPPSLEEKSLIEVAETVDLVLIPGAPAELATIVQTARTITQETNTPVATVLTRVPTSSMRASMATAATEALNSINCPVIGQIRAYSAMMAAPLNGKRPDQLPGIAKTQLAMDLQELISALDTRFTHA